MSELKTSYELALERMKGMGIDDTLSLTDEQKQRIAGIKRECEAKVAENKILMQGAAELPEEIRRLEQRRDEKIEELYREARQNRKSVPRLQKLRREAQVFRLNNGFIITPVGKGEHVIEPCAQPPAEIDEPHGQALKEPAQHRELIVAPVIPVFGPGNRLCQQLKRRRERIHHPPPKPLNPVCLAILGSGALICAIGRATHKTDKTNKQHLINSSFHESPFPPGFYMALLAIPVYCITVYTINRRQR
jgi:hypothetical protein